MSFLVLPADGSICVTELKEENVGRDVVFFLGGGVFFKGKLH